MAIPEKQLDLIRDELDNCRNPLFFYHDDPDGLCSFLLLYRYKQEGKGIVIKASSALDEKFLKKVEEYEPDRIFVLDLAEISPEFLEGTKTPIVWIDHHSPRKAENVKYFNPRLDDPDDNQAVSKICYDVVKQDLWIAAIGVVADWQYHDLVSEFSDKFPEILSKKINTPEKAMFDSRLGKLIKIFSFLLKGKMSETYKCIKILTRIETPEELLNGETSRSRFILKRYDSVNEEYQALLKRIKLTKPENGLLRFEYFQDKLSLTKDLSNETLYNNPDKVILIGREKNDEIKMSLRASHLNLPSILSKALINVQGSGGGHEHACGVKVMKEDYDLFISNIKKLI